LLSAYLYETKILRLLFSTILGLLLLSVVLEGVVVCLLALPRGAPAGVALDSPLFCDLVLQFLGRFLGPRLSGDFEIPHVLVFPLEFCLPPPRVGCDSCLFHVEFFPL